MTAIVMANLEGVSADRKVAETYKCCANCGKLYGHQTVSNWYAHFKDDNGEPEIRENNHVDFSAICHSNNKKSKKIFGFVPIGLPNKCPSWTHMGDEKAIGKLRLCDYRK